MSRENKRKKITLTQGELDNLIEVEVNRYSEFQSEVFIYAVALALHDLYGFGRERNSRALERIFTLMGGMCESPEMLNESKKEVYERFGITAKKG